MSSSDSGEWKLGPGKMLCGGCGRTMDLLPGSQDMGHSDGTELCDSAFIEARIMPTPERMAELEARLLLAVDPYDDRPRRPIPVGLTLVICSIIGLAVWGVVFALANSGIFK